MSRSADHRVVRPVPMHWAVAGGLGAALLLASPAPAQQGGREDEDAPPLVCPEERTLELDLDALRRALLAAPDDEAAQRAGLAQLGLLPPDDAPAWEPALEGSLDRFDVFEAELSDAAGADRVVQLIYHGSTATHQRIGVLAPLAEGRWCALGDLSIARRHEDASAFGEHGLPRTLAFVPLVEQGRQAIAVDDEGGRATGREFSGLHTRSYWAVDGHELRELFETTTLQRGGGYGGTAARVELRGGFPRTIVTTVRAVQGSQGGPGPGDDLPRIEVHAFDGGRYRLQEWARPDLACPAEQVLELDVDGLRTTLLHSASDPAAQRAGLQRLQLSAAFLPDEGAPWGGALQAFDRFEAPLVDPLQPDLVVQLRYEDEYREHLQIQVLHPLGEDRWCALGGDLSISQGRDEIPCLGGEHGRPRTIGFAYVTDAVRQVIWVADETGWCDGVGRSSDLTYSLWEVQGARLVEIFSEKTLQLSYRSPIPPMEVLEGQVTTAGAFPQGVIYRRERSCDPSWLLETDPCAPYDCAPDLRELHYLYTGTRYVAEGEHVLPPEPSMTVVTDGDHRVYYDPDGQPYAEGDCTEGGVWWFYDADGERGQFQNYERGRLR